MNDRRPSRGGSNRPPPTQAGNRPGGNNANRRPFPQGQQGQSQGQRPAGFRPALVNGEVNGNVAGGNVSGLPFSGGNAFRSGKGQQRGQGQRGGKSQRSSGQPQAPAGPALAPGTVVEGILAFNDDRHDGTLRDPAIPLRILPGNVIVPKSLIRDLTLRSGVLIRGTTRGRNVDQIELVEGRPAAEFAHHVALYDSTALDPEPVLKLEHDPAELTTRIIDILTPIGFGQRGLIVAPPRTGKTILLQNMARGIAKNYPDAELVLLLIDERPEEVTDMRRNVPGTVFASSNDNTVEKHLDLAQLIIERCKRKAEMGKNVIVLLDSLTRLGRAFNNGGPSGGRTMSGGLDNRALEIPKKLFGAARKIENGGSLTILATCLIDTGSKMDQIIFEEFKGTGNMELTLDRNLSNSRIYPAIDIASSGTRKEEKLLDARTLLAARNIRKHLMNMPPAQAMKSMIEALTKQKTNEALYQSMKV